MHYRLNADGTTEQMSNCIEWAEYFHAADRKVAYTELRTGGGAEVRVSTIFLGLDHSFLGGPPILFETMVFSEELLPGDTYEERYATKAEAEEGHKRVVAQVVIDLVERPA